MTKKISSLNELQLYINLLEDLHGKRQYNNYDVLIRDLLIEFGYVVTKDDLNRLYEPTIDEEVTDLRILYNNLS